MKPTFFKTRPKLKNVRFVDAYNSGITELFFLKHPSLKKGAPLVKQKLAEFTKTYRNRGLWIYFDDSKILVHTVNEQDYFKLRTARNKNLITEGEQKTYRDCSVGIAGLSVGSCVLAALVMSGGPKRIKIADFDTLELTNLNRIKAKLTDIGLNKTEIAAKQVWEVDPFAQISLFPNGLGKKNLTNFLLGKPKLDVFIDEMDSLPLKLEARFLCRQYKIPVLMATDNGDSVVLDVERFDREPKRKIFHGLLGDANPKKFENLNYRDWLALATKIVGPEYLTPAMQSSLLEIGKTLPSVPQLGPVASVAGAAMALALRRIASGQSMPSGRYVISLEEKLLPNYMSSAAVKSRKKQTEKFKKSFH
jgi:molybdopterin/thiamine biosynthesis adenylyltransferase